MTPKRAFIWLIVSVLIVQIHQVFDRTTVSGDIFPLAEYPQSFQWYLYTLFKTVSITIILGVYAFREPCKWLSYVVMTYWLFEVKEVFDYVLMANQNAFVYDVAVCLTFFVVFLLLQLKRLNLDSFEEERGYDYEVDHEDY